MTTFRKASTIKVPERLFQTCKTGVPEFDNTFSEIGGVVPSQVVFVTGKPGAGKTTLTLAITAKMFLSSKRPGAFVSLEMSDFQLALSAKKIPGFEQMMVSTDFSLENTISELTKMKPSAVVIDSIQKAAALMVKQGEAPNYNQAQKDIVSRFYAFAKKTFIPVFLVGHVSKSGSYIGPSHLEHEVDSHLTVEFDRDLNYRTFSFGKNRFGGSNDPQLFGITSEGVWIGSPYVVDRVLAEGDVAAAAERVAQVFSQFKQRNSSAKSVPPSEVNALAQEVVSYLRTSDAENIRANSHVGCPEKVKLSFDYRGVAQCIPKQGKIRIGQVMYTDRFKIGSIGYKKEQPFINRNVKNREDLYLWVLLHEWVHLYKGMQHHKVVFFSQVESLWNRVQTHLSPHLS
jgi:hypothetical protein